MPSRIRCRQILLTLQIAALEIKGRTAQEVGFHRGMFEKAPAYSYSSVATLIAYLRSEMDELRGEINLLHAMRVQNRGPMNPSFQSGHTTMATPMPNRLHQVSVLR